MNNLINFPRRNFQYDLVHNRICARCYSNKDVSYHDVVFGVDTKICKKCHDLKTACLKGFITEIEALEQISINTFFEMQSYPYLFQNKNFTI